jgi:hypothetical protein
LSSAGNHQTESQKDVAGIMDYSQKIKKKRKEVADLVREYAISQSDLWSKIPYLALMAGRQNNLTYDYGY